MIQIFVQIYFWAKPYGFLSYFRTTRLFRLQVTTLDHTNVTAKSIRIV